MEEAAVAHQVTVLKQGKIVAQGTPDALKQNMPMIQWLSFFKMHRRV